jgi:hypothetical protein
MMETRGFSTTVIGLVRYQMEQVRPPRGLWTPFQLGRPLGEPQDAPFQRRVLMQALNLLERPDGPVILEDFPDDPPGWSDGPGWRPPLVAAPAEAVPAPPAAWTDRFAAEFAAIVPFWELAKTRYGRTTIGLSGQPPEHWPSFVGAILRGELPTVAPHETTALSLRFLCDDIKALYSEAAQSVGEAPASRQIDDWFWRKTIAGNLLIDLRRLALTSHDDALKTVGARFIVPTAYVPA